MFEGLNLVKMHIYNKSQTQVAVILCVTANLQPFIISSKKEHRLNCSRFMHVPCLLCLLNTPPIAWHACTQAALGHSW